MIGLTFHPANDADPDQVREGEVEMNRNSTALALAMACATASAPAAIDGPLGVTEATIRSEVGFDVQLKSDLDSLTGFKATFKGVDISPPKKDLAGIGNPLLDQVAYSAGMAFRCDPGATSSCNKLVFSVTIRSQDDEVKGTCELGRCEYVFMFTSTAYEGRVVRAASMK